ncbi:MAG: hypothetical protein WBL40_19855 [Terrimicrobiaceae bacterium]
MSEHVPLHGVVSDDWGNLVREEEQGGAINRISYEWCVLTALREKGPLQGGIGKRGTPLSQSR